MSRWRPQIGDRVHRRWKAWLGEGLVIDVADGGAIVVRWLVAPPGKKRRLALLGFHSPAHLTRPGLKINSGAGRDSVDLFCEAEERKSPTIAALTKVAKEAAGAGRRRG